MSGGFSLDVIHWVCPINGDVEWIPAPTMFEVINTDDSLGCPSCDGDHDPSDVDMVQAPIETVMESDEVE